MNFKNKTVLITGATRGIGKSIALKLASEGANIVISDKSTEEDELLGGTIYSAAREVEAAGGKALAVYCDIRDEKLIQEVGATLNTSKFAMHDLETFIKLDEISVGGDKDK